MLRTRVKSLHLLACLFAQVSRFRGTLQAILPGCKCSVAIITKCEYTQPVVVKTLIFINSWRGIGVVLHKPQERIEMRRW